METRTDCASVAGVSAPSPAFAPFGGWGRGTARGRRSGAGNETRPAQAPYASHGQKPFAGSLEGGSAGGGPSHERTPAGAERFGLRAD